MRLILLLISSFFLAIPAAQAQQDSVFDSYDDYAAFVDKHVMSRDFSALILRLGGRDEYTPEEIEQSHDTLRKFLPRDFDNVTVFRRENLGGGVFQEGRIYWSGTGYAFFYALLHDRPDGYVVISFHFNTSSQKVMERF